MRRGLGLLLVSGSLVALVAWAVTFSGSVSDDEPVRSFRLTPAATASAAPTPRPTAVVDVPVASASLSTLSLPVSTPPARVQIPEIGIDMGVLPVGVKTDGEMEVPDDPSVAGWYRWGSDPRSGAGSTVIAAHVDSLRYGLGPFARLRDLVPGSEITVIGSDGGSHLYRVDGLSAFAKDALPAAELFERSGPSRLVLITCGGTFDETALTYSDNVVVTASPVL
ncbi:class F sortase [Amnibacterium flavum]|uniref:class F sortase n=1 Tax=Amnibacterium flavum TaxID=2173173 RepID=UPI001F0B80F2|nr:class F sortase [Amnibacterium flavum]